MGNIAKNNDFVYRNDFKVQPSTYQNNVHIVALVYWKSI